MNLKTILKLLGFNQKEAIIYIALLKLGEANIKEIADKTNISRTTLYTPIKNLTEKGYIEFYKRGERNYYIATSPEKIFKIKEGELSIFQENIELFKKLKNQSTNKPKIKIFEGSAGIKLLLNEILEEKRNFLAITCVDDMQKIAQEYFEDFILKRIKQGLRIKLLTNKLEYALELKSTDAEELRQTRFIPSSYNFNTANYIFGDKIAMFSLKQEPIIGILIKDKGISDTHRMYFDLIWKMASST